MNADYGWLVPTLATGDMEGGSVPRWAKEPMPGRDRAEPSWTLLPICTTSPSQQPFLGVCSEWVSLSIPSTLVVGVQAFYTGQHLKLCLCSWATKELRLMQCFCFPTDLDFVKSPSEAAALMAGFSGPVV